MLFVTKNDSWLWEIIYYIVGCYIRAHTHVFSKRDRGECVHRRHPFLTESSSRVRATLVRSDLADVRCVTSGCTFYLQKKVHNKSSDLSGGTGFSECEGPRKMRFPRGAACLALSKFKGHRCRNALCREEHGWIVEARKRHQGEKLDKENQFMLNGENSATRNTLMVSISSCC